MQALKNNEKFFVTEGATVGKITVLNVVQSVYHHPLLSETPRGYLNQGAIWECVCECGKHFLISQAILSMGRNKSCGCLRKTKRGVNWEKKKKALELRLQRMEVNSLIKKLRYELESLRIMPDRDEERFNRVADELRSAHAKRASIAAQYHPNGSRKRKITNPDKLKRLQEIGLLNSEEGVVHYAEQEIAKITVRGRKGLELT